MTTPLPDQPPAAEEISSADLQKCAQILQAVVKDSLILHKLSEQDRIAFLMAAGQATRLDKFEIRRRQKALRRQKKQAQRAVNHELRAATAIRKARAESFFVPPARLLEGAVPEAPARQELQSPDHCYICKAEFTQVHHFYDSLCPSCARFNYEKRFQSASLVGRVALITGARLKIGYQAALMMLRAGAHVIVSTRFARDAALRYSREPDFNEWAARLDIFGLDLRHSPSVEAFTHYLLQNYERLDILINNAAQTVRRPPGFYAHLIAGEEQPLHELPLAQQRLLRKYEDCKRALSQQHLGLDAQEGTNWISGWHQGKLAPVLGVLSAARLSQIPYACDATPESQAALFPEGKLDADLQQVDLRANNSWRMTLAEVPTAELLEVQLINSIAPFILCSKLKPLMLRVPCEGKHIVNVSAMEGKFARHTKTDKHPHTNMAKAALNMMTLTSARDYQRDGIYMNAVDTGWVTDEDPAELSARKQMEHDFQPPLDIVDGAARVMDPVFSGLLSNKHIWGNFLKDYLPTEW
jgi:NAD(P)-dependent dehydrogenase (short-subunit alcohol dehydrogenase family)